MSKRNCKVLLSICIFSLFIIGIQANKPSYEDVDCGYMGITEEECVHHLGCVWLENFPGPWCQHQGSPYIPSFYDIGFDEISPEQLDILKQSILSLVILSILSIIGTYKTPLPMDYIIVSILLVLAIGSRYYSIEHPKEVVFDEFYFGHFADSYCNRTYVFDIHPPLAKLTHYYFGSLLGQECNTMNFHAEDGEEKYDNENQYVPYRYVSAFFGTIVVPLGYLVGRQFNFSVESSILLGSLLLCDSLLLSETRLILINSQLFFYIVLSIYCAKKLWDSEANSSNRVFWTLATAIASGCAFCCKFTALATLGWIGFVTFVGVYSNKPPVSLLLCLIASIVSFIVFAIPFYFHILLGENSGENDWNVDVSYQKLLVGNVHYNPNAVAPAFLPHMIYLIKRMLEQNAASLGDHPYSSFWYEWIIGKGALLSYSEHIDALDWNGAIFIVSNVITCFTILICIGIFLVIALLNLRNRFFLRLSVRKTYFLKTGFLFLLGWIANLVPYALVARTTYSYHYLPGQFYGMMMICLVFDELSIIVSSLLTNNRKSYLKYRKLVRVLMNVLFMTVLFWSYFYYSCFSYGFGITTLEYSKRAWIVNYNHDR